MLPAMLIALQLVQAGDFVEFDVCYLDTMASPWEFRPHPGDLTFYVRPGQILAMTEVEHKTEGIDCVRICGSLECKFVVGTIDSVRAKLSGAKNASP